ncbi:protein TolR [bacterium]|nr:protein TolR [bacterium]
MKVKHHEQGKTELAEINIIPLVDIMLVLLIIFMVAAPMLQQGIDIDLPEVSAQAVKATNEDFVVSISGDRKIYLGDNKKDAYTIDTVGDKIKAIFETKEKKELYLRADKNIEYGFVMEVMGICQSAGVERVGMITTPNEEKPSNR